MALKNNTWKLNQWYDQNVAGNITYAGAKEFLGMGGLHMKELLANIVKQLFITNPKYLVQLGLNLQNIFAVWVVMSIISG